MPVEWGVSEGTFDSVDEEEGREQCKPNGKAATAAVDLEDFVAYMPMHRYIYRPDGDLWPAASIDARIPRVSILDTNGKPKSIKASTWLDQRRPVEQMTWAPGEPKLIKDRLIAEGGWIERKDATVFNLY